MIVPTREEQRMIQILESRETIRLKRSDTGKIMDQKFMTYWRMFRDYLESPRYSFSALMIPAAPYVIRRWVNEQIARGLNQEGDDKIKNARACADEMERQKRMEKA